MIYEIENKRPKIHPEVTFISENAVIFGDVEIGKGVTIFDNVVIEGFPNKVIIGNFTNIQSGTIIHGLHDSDTIIGKYCTIGHNSIIHGCTLEDYTSIGMGSTIMGKTILKKGCYVGSNSLIPERKTFPEYALIYGTPGIIKKINSSDSIKLAKAVALGYSEFGKLMKKRIKIN